MNFTNWLARELSAARAAVDEIPPEKRKGLRVALFRLRAREVESANRLFDEYEIWYRHENMQDPAKISD